MESKKVLIIGIMLFGIIAIIAVLPVQCEETSTKI